MKLASSERLANEKKQPLLLYLLRRFAMMAIRQIHFSLSAISNRLLAFTNNNRGYSLVTTLFIGAIVLSTSVTSVSMLANQFTSLGHYRDVTNAQALAKAGINAAVEDLNSDNPTIKPNADTLTGTLDTGSYKVTFDFSTNTLISTGTVDKPGVQNDVVRAIETKLTSQTGRFTETFSDTSHKNDMISNKAEWNGDGEARLPMALLNGNKTIGAGYKNTVAISSNGRVQAIGNGRTGQLNVGNWTDIKAVAVGSASIIALKYDGTVLTTDTTANKKYSGDVSSWTNIKSIAAGWSHTVGVKNDGTVVVVGGDRNNDGQPDNSYGQLNVEDWTNIVAVSAGTYHTVGLKEDGTVVAVGERSSYDNYDQNNVSNWKNIKAISAGAYHTVGLKEDGTVVAVGDNEPEVDSWGTPGGGGNEPNDIKAICGGYNFTVGLQNDGAVVATSNAPDISNWPANIKAIAAGFGHVVGLKSDGAMVGAGSNRDGQLNFDNWSNIIEIAAGGEETAALYDNGNVTAVGRNTAGELEVQNWSNIKTTHNDWTNKSIAVGWVFTIGLKNDGTVVTTDTSANKRYSGDVSNWTNIKSIAAGWNHSLGLKEDGTVVSTYYDVSSWKNIKAISAGRKFVVGVKNDGNKVVAGTLGWWPYINVGTWTNLIEIAAGEKHYVGLKDDGTVSAFGQGGFEVEGNYGQTNVSGWTNIKAIAAGYYHTVGLKNDGTVVAVGYNVNGQCNVDNWSDIVAIAAGGYHTVGLKANGTVVSVGDNNYGQLATGGDWSNILFPDEEHFDVIKNTVQSLNDIISGEAIRKAIVHIYPSNNSYGTLDNLTLQTSSGSINNGTFDVTGNGPVKSIFDWGNNSGTGLTFNFNLNTTDNMKTPRIDKVVIDYTTSKYLIDYDTWKISNPSP